MVPARDRPAFGRPARLEKQREAAGLRAGRLAWNHRKEPTARLAIARESAGRSGAVEKERERRLPERCFRNLSRQHLRRYSGDGNALRARRPAGVDAHLASRSVWPKENRSAVAAARGERLRVDKETVELDRCGVRSCTLRARESTERGKRKGHRNRDRNDHFDDACRALSTHMERCARPSGSHPPWRLLQ